MNLDVRIAGLNRYVTQCMRVFKKPYLVFLIIGLVFGLFHVFFVPPFGDPDEAAHFNRVYQISKGHFLGETIPGGKGMYIPARLNAYEHSNDTLVTGQAKTSMGNVIEDIFRNTSSIDTQNGHVPVHFENTELYNPVAYAPQVVGMWFARLVHMSIPGTFYLLRLTGLAVWLTICAVAIRKLGWIGWAAMVLVLTPLSLQIASSVSADGIVVATSLLFVGILIETFRQGAPLTNRYLLLLLSVLVLLACVKLPYVALAALLPLVPSTRFTSCNLSKKQVLLISAAVVIFVAGGWTVLAQKGYVPYRTAAAGVPLVQKTQEEYIMTRPFSFLHKLYMTYLRDTPYNGSPTLGYISELGLLNYGIASWAIALYFILIGSTFTRLRGNSDSGDYLSGYTRVYVLLVVFAIFMLINVLIFISWSRISFPVIEGIQSRYFIPALIPLIFVFLPIHRRYMTRTETSRLALVVVLCLLVIHIAAAVAVYHQFYVPPLAVVS